MSRKLDRCVELLTPSFWWLSNLDFSLKKDETHFVRAVVFTKHRRQGMTIVEIFSFSFPRGMKCFPWISDKISRIFWVKIKIIGSVSASSSPSFCAPLRSQRSSLHPLFPDRSCLHSENGKKSTRNWVISLSSHVQRREKSWVFTTTYYWLHDGDSPEKNCKHFCLHGHGPDSHFLSPRKPRKTHFEQIFGCLGSDRDWKRHKYLQ